MCVCQKIRTVSIHIRSEGVPLSHARGDTVARARIHGAVVEWCSMSVGNVRCIMTIVFIILVQDATQERSKGFISIVEVVRYVLEDCSQML